MFHAERIRRACLQIALVWQTPAPDLSNWRKFVERVVSPKKNGSRSRS